MKTPDDDPMATIDHLRDKLAEMRAAGSPDDAHVRAWEPHSRDAITVPASIAARVSECRRASPAFLGSRRRSHVRTRIHAR